jgi:hypothetical protein
MFRFSTVPFSRTSDHLQPHRTTKPLWAAKSLFEASLEFGGELKSSLRESTERLREQLEGIKEKAQEAGEEIQEMGTKSGIKTSCL